MCSDHCNVFLFLKFFLRLARDEKVVYFVCLQSHQNEVEIFDENLAHISTWLYQTQIHLDEAERLTTPERKNVLKVRQSKSLHFRDDA